MSGWCRHTPGMLNGVGTESTDEGVTAGKLLGGLMVHGQWQYCSMAAC